MLSNAPPILNLKPAATSSDAKTILKTIQPAVGLLVIIPGSGGEYSVSFSGAGDFVVGKGWTTGSAQAITFSGSFSATSGAVLLSIYGWTENPLIEYYIVEDYNIPPTATLKGTVTSDGGTYNIYENTRTNEPSILGTSTFNQFISVRQSTRSSGTVTTANHFNAWKSLGLTLGTTWSYQILATEGYNSASGSVTQTVGTGTGSTTGTGTGSTGTVAKYGQCGGTGYTGSTTCASGSTCTYSNAWYSQCL